MVTVCQQRRPGSTTGRRFHAIGVSPPAGSVRSIRRAHLVYAYFHTHPSPPSPPLLQLVRQLLQGPTELPPPMACLIDHQRLCTVSRVQMCVQ